MVQRHRNYANGASSDGQCDKIQLDDADTAFILGKGGKTKWKIARVSTATLELYERSNTLEIRGTPEARKKALKYVELVRAQRVGPVHVDTTHDDGDLTMIDVPHSCVGFVTGSSGNFLRMIEDEWSTLMFFCDYQSRYGFKFKRKSSATGADGEPCERLAIFGDLEGRRGAELKVMGAIETKLPGYFTKALEFPVISNEEFGTDLIGMSQDELSFALGKDGLTRRKLARASDCILEYIGYVAFIAGYRENRTRGREYLIWLLQQRNGPVNVADKEKREDLSTLKVPSEYMGILKGPTLREVEQETATYIFVEGDVDLSSTLLVFGRKRDRRRAEKMVRELVGIVDEVTETSIELEVALPSLVDGDAIPKEKLDQIGENCRTKVEMTNDKTIRITGPETVANYCKKIVTSYLLDMKVEDNFYLPKGLPFHVLTAKLEGSQSVLESVRSQTRVRIRIFPDQRRIFFIGPSNAVVAAKREIENWLAQFITEITKLEKHMLNALSEHGKEHFPKLVHARHMVAAKINRDNLTLTLTGAPTAVHEAKQGVANLFEKNNWNLAECVVETFPMYPGLRKSDLTKSCEWVRLNEHDSAFILGRNGKTKMKIARVSGATLELHEQTDTVEITGTAEERRKARKYIDLVRAQRVGPVQVDERLDDGDLAMIDVPHSCVGFVTGSNGIFLRLCEEEWGTLMFFCDYHGKKEKGAQGERTERLAIFGDKRGRSGAELKVMGAIETKIPGYFTHNITKNYIEESAGWGTDLQVLVNDDLSFALGKDGTTRKKLAKASGGILEYIGNVAYIAGIAGVRQRTRDYLEWLITQRTGPMYLGNVNRPDVEVLSFSAEKSGYGRQGGMIFKSASLRSIEHETGTFCFLEGNTTTSDRLIICGHSSEARRKARNIAMEMLGRTTGDAKEDTHGSDFADTFQTGGIDVHVILQTGPEGEDPVIEVCEQETKVKLECKREKQQISIAGTLDQIAKAKKFLAHFFDKFQTVQIRIPDDIMGSINATISHYIRPLPWIAVVEVNEQELVLQGHADAMRHAMTVLENLFMATGYKEGIPKNSITHKAARENTSFTRGNVEVIRVTDDDAAFILGRGGKTKQKIVKVSGAQIDLLERNNQVEISGTEEQRRRAHKYVSLVRAQRVGPVHVDYATHDDGDLTIIDVPNNCVGFVTGTQGTFLRMCEQEWSTLMFFCDYSGPSEKINAERLAIFGERAGRAGAELKVMAAIETKIPGYFENMSLRKDEDDWEWESQSLHKEQLSYALGKKGTTRKKLARASACIVEYVGNRAYMVGSREQRSRAKDYLKWLCDQIDTDHDHIIMPAPRSDCTLVRVPTDCVGYVMGDRRKTLSNLEQEFGTLIFFAHIGAFEATYKPDRHVGDGGIGLVMNLTARVDPPRRNRGKERRERRPGSFETLAIFGASLRGRVATVLKMMGAVEAKTFGFFTDQVENFHSQEEWGIDTINLEHDEVSFALGRDGSTRKKLVAAAGCILEFLQHTCYIAGTREERRRGADYLGWLLQQRKHRAVQVKDLDLRDDVYVMDLPDDVVDKISPPMLRDLEARTQVFAFLQNETRLLCFSYSANARLAAKQHLHEAIPRLKRGENIVARRERHRGHGRDRRRRQEKEHNDNDGVITQSEEEEEEDDYESETESESDEDDDLHDRRRRHNTSSESEESSRNVRDRRGKRTCASDSEHSSGY